MVVFKTPILGPTDGPGKVAGPKNGTYLCERRSCRLALLAEMSRPFSSPKLAPFLTVFQESRSRMNFTTLEPLPKGRRTEGFFI